VQKEAAEKLQIENIVGLEGFLCLKDGSLCQIVKKYAILWLCKKEENKIVTFPYIFLV